MRASVSLLNFYDEVNLSEMELDPAAAAAAAGDVIGGGGRGEASYAMECRCGDYFRLMEKIVEGVGKGGSVAVHCHSCSNVIRVHI